MFSKKTGIVAVLAGVTFLGAGVAGADSFFVESTTVSYSHTHEYVYTPSAESSDEAPVWQKNDAPVAQEDLVVGFRSASNQIAVEGTEIDEMASSRNRAGDTVVTVTYKNGLNLTLSRAAGQSYYVVEAVSQ